MKNMILTLLIVFGGPLLLTHCGNKGGGGSPGAPVGGGIVTTDHGALPQGTCPPNYGMEGAMPNATCRAASLPGNVCPPNQVQTQFGCLESATCPAGQGRYGTSCVGRKSNPNFQNAQNFNNSQYR